MRLNSAELTAIAQAARETFPLGTVVSLFGSRLNDEACGGDIDLLIEESTSPSASELVAQRSAFRARLYQLLEERRIDVIITSPTEADNNPVVREARKTAKTIFQT